MAEKSKFKLERVEELPQRKLLRARERVYDEILEAVMRDKRGIFKVSVPNKPTKTVYSALIKRIKERPFKQLLKLHIRNDELYIEKLE